MAQGKGSDEIRRTEHLLRDYGQGLQGHKGGKEGVKESRPHGGTAGKNGGTDEAGT